MKHTILTLGFLLFSIFVFSQSEGEHPENSKRLPAAKKIVVLPPVDLVPINPNATVKDLEKLKSTKRAVNHTENNDLISSPSQHKDSVFEKPKNSALKKKIE